MLINSKNSHMYGDIFFPLGITTHIMLDRKTTNDAHMLQPAKVLIRMWLPAPIFAAEFLTKAYTAAISKIVANGNEKKEEYYARPCKFQSCKVTRKAERAKSTYN